MAWCQPDPDYAKTFCHQGPAAPILSIESGQTVGGAGCQPDPDHAKAFCRQRSASPHLDCSFVFSPCDCGAMAQATRFLSHHFAWPQIYWGTVVEMPPSARQKHPDQSRNVKRKPVSSRLSGDLQSNKQLLNHPRSPGTSNCERCAPSHGTSA